MSRNIRVIFVILSLIFIIFAYQIIRFYSDEKTVLIKTDPETRTVSSLGGDYYSFGQRGFYGVTDSKGKVIIEARWKSVSKLEGDCFIVSVSSPDGDRYGVIDNKENVVVPFIYRKFEKMKDEFITAETENGKYVLFDSTGKVLIDDEWDSISRNYPGFSFDTEGNYVQLENGSDFYRITLDKEGRYVMSDIRMFKDVFGERKLVKIKNTAVSPGIGEIYRICSEIFDRSVEYIGAVFNNDSAGIKNLAWSENYRDLLLEGLNLRGGELTGMDTPVPEITDSEDGSVIYVCHAAVTYTSPDDVRWDGTYTSSDHFMTLDIHFKKRVSGSLAITKVYASRKD